MLKRKKVVAGIIVVVAAVLIVSYVFQHIQNKKWFNSHQFIYEIKKEQGYIIKRITDKRLSYHHGSEFTPDTKFEDQIDGYIIYDTMQHTFWVETTEYIIPEDEESIVHEYTEWMQMDLNGNVIDKRTEVDSIDHKSWILLKTEITPFYKWKDKTNAFYVQHFARERFNWESLNPLRNYGSPTGGRPPTYWEGVAYLKLQMEKSVIPFKTKTSTTDRSYSFSIDLYRIPEQYAAGQELVFLYIDEYFLNFEDKGLYLIMQE